MLRSGWFVFVPILGLLASTPAKAETLDDHLRSPEQLLSISCPSEDSLLLPKTFFTICYHTKWRIARWVAYFLTAPDLEGDVDRTEDFREDEAITNEADRSRRSDYVGSGYHRGHMAPADAFDRSERAMSTTFLLSNMAPQTPSLNSGKWRSLESRVRKVITAHRGVWIVTGNLFAEADRSQGIPNRTFESIVPADCARNDTKCWIGNGRVAVPTHSFKAILVARDSGKFGAYGFIMPNQRTRLPGEVKDYQVSVDEVERLTGINVFSALVSVLQNRLEADVPAWPPKRERRG